MGGGGRGGEGVQVSTAYMHGWKAQVSAPVSACLAHLQEYVPSTGPKSPLK